MKLTLSPLLVVLALAACTSADRDDTYAIACSSIPTADALFQVYAGTGKVSASLVADEQAAIAGAQAICSGPRPANVKSALAAVNRAATAILGYIAKAKTQAAT